MARQRLSSTTAALCVAAAMLAGCGGSQPSIGTPGAMQQSQAIATRASRGGSWMAVGLEQRDLLYVVSNGRVDVYRYWQRKHVGVLMNFSEPLDACADHAGDVYIVDGAREIIYEYAHGGKTPFKMLNDSPYEPYACSVDSDGDLAVANNGYPYYEPGNLAIYHNGSGKPLLLQGNGSRGDEFTGCAYDDTGDLLAMTKYDVSSEFRYEFYYLPRTGTKLRLISLPDLGRYNAIQGVTWDGEYWVVGPITDQLNLYSINKTAHYVSVVTLPEGSLSGSVAIYRKNFASRGTQVVEGVNDFYPEDSVVYWDYPAGGNPLGSFVDFSEALAISLGRR